MVKTEASHAFNIGSNPVRVTIEKKQLQLIRSCFFLFSRAVSSQVLRADAGLTDLSRDGAGGVPNQANEIQKRTTAFVVVLLRVGASYFAKRVGLPSIAARGGLN